MSRKSDLQVYNEMIDTCQEMGLEMVLIQHPEDKIGIARDKMVIQLTIVVRDPDSKKAAAKERVKHPEHIEQAAIRMRDKMLEKGQLGA